MKTTSSKRAQLYQHPKSTLHSGPEWDILPIVSELAKTDHTGNFSGSERPITTSKQSVYAFVRPKHQKNVIFFVKKWQKLQ